MDVLHKPVMVLEVLEALGVASDGTYIDCTVGEGGHSEAILDAVNPTPRLLGFDLDTAALDTAKRRLERFWDRVTLVQGSYAGLRATADELGLSGISGVLMDLGLSSLQLGTDERGFSFARTGKLDMRFDGKQDLTAGTIVNTWSEQELADSIYQLGEERASRRIARAIVRARPLSSSTELAKVVAGAAGRTRQGKVHPATRTFQAIRMAVNGELENVQAGLAGAVEALQQGGKLVVISYHSLEDRLVKGFLRTEASQCICPPETPVCVCGHEPTIKLVRRRVIKPSDEEIEANPRARSARLRVAEKL
ncbi:MAG: 16S rRNA (cytosine(1402)-N(4))-methyltransferase RsmH [SAR202 cluster bacterium]|nr:16S rRNA (cytosine(1402)-N(4))-methyltransferase RsmH [SAR202 cluster bacterium]